VTDGGGETTRIRARRARVERRLGLRGDRGAGPTCAGAGASHLEAPRRTGAAPACRGAGNHPRLKSHQARGAAPPPGPGIRHCTSSAVLRASPSRLLMLVDGLVEGTWWLPSPDSGAGRDGRIAQRVPGGRGRSGPGRAGGEPRADSPRDRAPGAGRGTDRPDLAGSVGQLPPGHAELDHVPAGRRRYGRRPGGVRPPRRDCPIPAAVGVDLRGTRPRGRRRGQP
jgi:hypothetical protein